MSTPGGHGPGPAGPGQQQIIAMGGGGFTMGDRSPALDRLVLELTGKPIPKVCFLPTASGDPREQVIRFYERFETWPCEPSTLSLFHLRRDRLDPESHLLAQDAIYVGGGSMRNMLAIWREHHLEQAMRDAWRAGILLAGLSAGAMCWFEGGISTSAGRPEIVKGLGLLSGSLSVHRGTEPERLPAYVRAVADGRLPAGFAADDGAALIFRGRRLAESVAVQPGRGVTRIAQGPHGVVAEEMPVRILEDEIRTPAGVVTGTEEMAVSEYRALHFGHRRD